MENGVLRRKLKTQKKQIKSQHYEITDLMEKLKEQDTQMAEKEETNKSQQETIDTLREELKQQEFQMEQKDEAYKSK